MVAGIVVYSYFNFKKEQKHNEELRRERSLVAKYDIINTERVSYGYEIDVKITPRNDAQVIRNIRFTAIFRDMFGNKVYQSLEKSVPGYITSSSAVVDAIRCKVKYYDQEGVLNQADPDMTAFYTEEVLYSNKDDLNQYITIGYNDYYELIKSTDMIDPIDIS